LMKFAYMYVIILLCFLPLSLCSEHVGAVETGRIAGRVCSADGGIPLYGAFVMVLDNKLGGMTLRDGGFTIAGVPAGMYSVQAVMHGFAPQSTDSVEVIAGQTFYVEFTLAYDDTLEIYDCTGGTSSYCEVYDAEKQLIIMSVWYQLAPDSEYLSGADAKIYDRAREKLFPHCDVLCTPELKDGKRTIKIFYCPKCCEAKK
jgi:hypothetical protein